MIIDTAYIPYEFFKDDFFYEIGMILLKNIEKNPKYSSPLLL